MHLRSSQFIVSFQSYIANAKILGLGVAIATSAIVGQANAQIDISLSDNSPAAQVLGNGFQERLDNRHVVDQLNRYDVDQNGQLNGRITTSDSASGALNVFLMQDKKIIQKVTTDSSGEFSLVNVMPGRYSIVAAGNNQVGAQGVMVDRFGTDQTGKAFTMAAIGTEYKGVQELINTTLPKQIVNHIHGSVMNRVTPAAPGDNAASGQVRIVNGKLHGQVSSLYHGSHAEGVVVHLVQNDQPIAQVETDAMGKFAVPDAEPGLYDVVAISKKGFAAMRIEALGKRSPMQQVSYRKQVANVLNISLAEDVPSGQFVDQDDDEGLVVMDGAVQNPIEYASESIGFGGANGGSAGSVGNLSNLGRPLLGGRGGGLLGGGNGGGLARLISLGGVAGAIVAIADDDDAAPSSPSGSE